MDVDGDPVPDGWIFQCSVDVRRKNHPQSRGLCCVRDEGDRHRQARRRRQQPGALHLCCRSSWAMLPATSPSVSVGRGKGARRRAHRGRVMTAPHHTTPHPRGRPRQIQRANDSWPLGHGSPNPNPNLASWRALCFLILLFFTVRSKSARGPFYRLLLETLPVVVE